MQVAIYGHTFDEEFNPYIGELFTILNVNNIKIKLFSSFLSYIKDRLKIDLTNIQEFSSPNELKEDTDLIISIGGDGTFLNTVPFAVPFDIPAIGLNSGRLGYLANISKNEIKPALNALFSKNYSIDKRALIQILKPKKIFKESNLALNDITVQKKGLGMITIDVFLDNEFLNTYWTDGLIISTPTGSTAYSLSVGGPIVVPGSNNFILAPIASHNLTVRPIVIPDNKTIKLKIRTRNKKCLITADHRKIELETDIELIISKAEKSFKMLKLPNNNYYETLRNKLMWGVDLRN